jgi:hypothetical protein
VSLLKRACSVENGTCDWGVPKPSQAGLKFPRINKMGELPETSRNGSCSFAGHAGNPPTWSPESVENVVRARGWKSTTILGRCPNLKSHFLRGLCDHFVSFAVKKAFNREGREGPPRARRPAMLRGRSLQRKAESDILFSVTTGHYRLTVVYAPPFAEYQSRHAVASSGKL